MKEMHFQGAPSTSYRQVGTRLSPFGLWMQGGVHWLDSSEKVDLGMLIYTDLSSHILSYGGEAAFNIKW